MENQDTKKTDGGLDKEMLKDIASRLPHGSYVEIGKRVKRSDDYIRNFYNGQYDIYSKTALKIFDKTLEYLKEITNNKSLVKTKIDSILTDFPKVKA